MVVVMRTNVDTGHARIANTWFRNLARIKLHLAIFHFHAVRHLVVRAAHAKHIIIVTCISRVELRRRGAAERATISIGIDQIRKVSTMSFAKFEDPSTMRAYVRPIWHPDHIGRGSRGALIVIVVLSRSKAY